MDPLVSVNIITYNRAQMLGRALASVAAQTLSECEIIVVDDGSTDGTEASVRSIKDGRIRYLRVPHSGNIAHLRNIAMTQSSAPFIAFLDSDDEWDRNKLSRQRAFMRQFNLDLCYTNALTLDLQGSPRGYLRGFPSTFEGVFPLPKLFRDWHIIMSTVMMVRPLTSRIGMFDESLTAVSDSEFILRAMSQRRVGGLNEPLTLRHAHIQQHSRAHEINAYREMTTVAAAQLHRGEMSQFQYVSVFSRLAYRGLKAKMRHIGTQEEP